MRSRLFKSLMATILALVMLGAPLTVAASAQPGQGLDDQYIPRPPAPVDCSNVPPLTLSIGSVIATYPEIYLQCVSNIVLDACGLVLYDGPPLASLLIRAPMPPLPQDCDVITGTAIVIGQVPVTTELELTDEQIATFGRVPNPGVPPVAIPVGSGQGFAVTGSNVSLPIAVGVTLVGAGGIALAVARRRQHESSTPAAA